MTKQYAHTMQTLLAEWTKREGGPLHKKFAILSNRSFDDPADAEALCAALDHPRADEIDEQIDDMAEFRLSWADPCWYQIAWQIYQADSDPVREVVRNKGLPRLKSRLQQSLAPDAEWKNPKNHSQGELRYLSGVTDHFLFLISLLVIYGDDDATNIIVKAAKHSHLSTAGSKALTLGSWPSVFLSFVNDLDRAVIVLDALREPLPSADAAEGYLIFANQLAVAMDEQFHHPFDNPPGVQSLLRLSTEVEGDRDIDDPTAFFVAKALPHLRSAEVELLVAKLSKHSNRQVKAALREFQRGQRDHSL